MKRRRQSYRGKSTHTSKKNYTEVLFPSVLLFVILSLQLKYHLLSRYAVMHSVLIYHFPGKPVVLILILHWSLTLVSSHDWPKNFHILLNTIPPDLRSLNVTVYFGNVWQSSFYCAMHFSANAHSWDRMSSVCLSVCPSVTLVICNHIGWKSWKLIARTISPTPSLFVAKRRSTYTQGNMGKLAGD